MRLLNTAVPIVRLPGLRAFAWDGDWLNVSRAETTCRTLAVAAGHVEAGLRSRDGSMPQEINRRLTRRKRSASLGLSAMDTQPKRIARIIVRGSSDCLEV